MNLNFSLLMGVFVLYTAMLFILSWFTSRKADDSAFFKAGNKAPWFIVAYGMIGTSISGVTFISVPGQVLTDNFYYMPMILGFVVGYAIIALVLVPLYFRLKVTSIYSYLEQRFGFFSYKTGSGFFILSRVLGAAVRVYVVVLVLFMFIPKEMNVPFWVVASIFMALIFLYTRKGGIKTIIWTDTLQTTFMVTAVVATIYAVSKELGFGLGEMFSNIRDAGYTKMVNWDWSASRNIVKQFVGGTFVAVAMTGLDQEMMQKTISIDGTKAAKKSMLTLGGTMVIINYIFLLLGAVLALYVSRHGGLTAMGLEKTDQIFVSVATEHLGSIAIAMIFAVGLISAAYPSAAGALVSLTTAWCVDFAGFKHRADLINDEAKRKRIRNRTHSIFTLIFIAIIVVLHLISNDAVIVLVYKIASYTYGPLLGLFFFGILTKYQVHDRAIPYIAVASPIICFFIQQYVFDFGFSLLIVNGVLTFLGMWLFKKR